MKSKLIKIILIDLVLVGLIAAVQSMASENIWPMFQQNQFHTGRGQYLVPDNEEIGWTYDFGNLGSNRVISSQAAVDSKGIIYVGVGEVGVNSWGKLFAFYPNGEIKWEFSDLGSPPFTSTIGSSGTIYVPTYNRGIYALNPDGTEKWRFFVEGMTSIQGITIGNDGTIYFMVYVSGASNQYRFYALNPDGSEKWVKFGPRGGLTIPAVGNDGTICVVWQGFQSLTDQQRGNLSAYDSDGVLKWSKALEFAASSPAIGPEGNIYINAGVHSYFGTLKYLVAFSPAGDKLWQTPAWEYGSLYTPVITSNGDIIVADRWSIVCGQYIGYYVWCPKSRIRAYNNAGENLWSLEPDGYTSVDTQQIADVENNLVITRTFYEKIGTWPIAVQRQLSLLKPDGSTKWDFDINVSTPFKSSPVMGKNGYLYAALEEPRTGNIYNIKLYAFGIGPVNVSPIAAFTWSPEEPMSNEEITFDASSSYDEDGQITMYNWDFDDGSTDEGKTVTHTYPEIGDYTVTLTVTDDNGENNGLSKTITIKTNKWSFAIITDLHIGRGYPDYDGTTYEDGGDGEDYYLTERLEKVVNWINTNKNNIDCDGTKCSIKFLAVLGDITNTAEKSQFLKAKEILDKLNDPNGDGNSSDGIPYVPVFGNHDVWPYTDNGEAGSPQGEDFFEETFWNENAINMKLLHERFGFQRDSTNQKYKNSAFSYREMNFIGLDFNSRTHVPSPGLETGVWPEAILYTGTTNWLKDCIETHDKCLQDYENNSYIILSHIPLVERSLDAFDSDEINKIKEIINGKDVLANFGGHIHGAYPFLLPWLTENFMEANIEYSSINNTKVITTEALMVGSNENDEYLKQNDKGIIKIVKVLGESELNYETNEGKYNPQTEEEKEFIALNPYISFTFEKPLEFLWPCVIFKAHAFTKREVSYHWDFGDGTTGSGKWENRCYSSPGVYNVTLTLTDTKSGEKEYITQKVNLKEGIIPKFIKIADEVADKVEVISMTLQESLTKFGRTIKDTVLIRVKHSEAKPVGLITVHFEKAIEDIDLTQMMADQDIERRKSVLYMSHWPEMIEQDKILFIPK